jgi:hypothetical protein
MSKWKRRYKALKLRQTEQALGAPISIRTLTIGFDSRTVTIGRSTFTTEHPFVSIPIVSTDRLLLPDGLRESYPDLSDE